MFLTNFLVEKGFADDQNYPYLETLGKGVSQITYPNAQMGSMLRNVPYPDIYEEQRVARAFNARMLDGALIQMVYEFRSGKITRCRLAFLPSPNLLEFQNEPELYMDDSLYAEVIDKQVVTVPIRFDFDDRKGVPTSIEHPKSHVTLGQYKNCRIAATAPVTPGVFIGFILRHFYNTAFIKVSKDAPCFKHRWDSSITDGESNLPHLAIP